MDKATYLQKKAEAKAQSEKFKREEYCYTCDRVSENCLCHLIKPFETKTHFVILMHPMEAKKEKMGTGRLSKASLINSKIIIGIDFTQDFEVNSILQNPDNFCMVLYPGMQSLNISSDDVSVLATNKKQLVVFLIDGTWPCAKKMMKLSKNIYALPRISFTANHQSIFFIKEQPADYCLSTLESIHFFLTECERRGLETLSKKQDNMIDVFQAMIDFQIQCSLDPAKSSYRHGKMGYSAKEDRKHSKKWGTRRIVLD